MRILLGVFVVTILSIGMLMSHTVVSAQATCPNGSVEITPATRAAASAAGIPTTLPCWDPNNPNAGQAAGDAKLWLQQHATNDANISCLNTQFAEKLKTFMQAVPGGIPTITAGYRGQAEQEQAVASGASKVHWCQGYHNYGLAADFNNSSSQTQQWMRINAPQYGLAPTNVNPVTGCASSGFCDTGHIQMGGPLPSTNQCGICNSNGTGVLPSQGGGTASLARPTSPFSSPLSNLTGTPSSATPAATSPSTQPTITPNTATAGTSCTPQFSCVGNTIYFQSASCSQQVYQTCQYGCTGTVCSPAPGSQSSSTSLISPNNTLGSSVQDMLTSLLTPVGATSTQIATATPLSLTTGLFNITQIGAPEDITTGRPVPPNNPATSSNPLDEYQTFTSPDLGSSYTYSPTGTSPLLQLFANIRGVLSNILSFLQPGSAQPPVQYYNSME